MLCNCSLTVVTRTDAPEAGKTTHYLSKPCEQAIQFLEDLHTRLLKVDDQNPNPITPKIFFRCSIIKENNTPLTPAESVKQIMELLKRDQ